MSSLVDTGGQISLVNMGLVPPECLTTSRRLVRLKVADDKYIMGGTIETEIAVQFVNHRALSRPELGKKILLKGNVNEAPMVPDMVLG